jgi:hypothetical protein
MNLFPENIDGQRVKTDVKGLGVRQGFTAHVQINPENAVAGNNTGVLAATPLTASEQAIITNITNPTVPRNVTIIGNAVGIAGNVVVKGTNYNGDQITETLALNGTTTVAGNKAFKTITEIDLPVQTAAGNTVSVGVGEKLGLPYKLDHNTILATYFDNVKEAIAPTVTTSSTTLELNTIDLNSALNGKVVDVYLFV